MPKAPPRGSTQRDCRFDHLVAAAIAKGYGTVLVVAGIESAERGHDIRRGLYRCGRHRELSTDAGPSRLVDDDETMGLRATGDTFELRFRIWSKSSGRARLLERHGSDRAAWPYDPRRKKNQEDIDAWAAQGLNEKGHRIR